MMTLWKFCALDSGLLLVRKADSYTCSIELKANLLHDNSGFRLAAGNKGRFLYVFDRAGSLLHDARIAQSVKRFVFV